MVGRFSGFVVAAPRQKFAGGKEGHMKKLCTRSTDGKGEGLHREGRGR